MAHGEPEVFKSSVKDSVLSSLAGMVPSHGDLSVYLFAKGTLTFFVEKRDLFCISQKTGKSVKIKSKRDAPRSQKLAF